MVEEKETKSKDPLPALVSAGLVAEKLRVQLQVRQSHLLLQGRSDPETDELLKRTVSLEEYIDGRVAVLLKAHPAYPWFSKVSGVGGENIGKIVGPVDIRKAGYISSLWKFAGFANRKQCIKCGAVPTKKVERVLKSGETKVVNYYDDDVMVCSCGSAEWRYISPKKVEGMALEYNSRLRSMCWRLAGSLLKAGLRTECPQCGTLTSATKCRNCQQEIEDGKTVAITEFAAYYLKEKAKYREKYENRGRAVVPVTELPKVKGKRQETDKLISEGHVHNQTLRKMIKLFLACLWLVWRKAEGLPVTAPYAIDVLGHDSFIDPWKMTDR